MTVAFSDHTHLRLGYEETAYSHRPVRSVTANGSYMYLDPTQICMQEIEMLPIYSLHA